jgi:glycosyltransferase involved in cell wall biosynthesis
MYLAETRHLVKVAHERDGMTHCRWFPTARPMHTSAQPGLGGTTCRRFVFVSHVREYKGVRELVDAAERLDASTTVDVYGPLFDDLPTGLFERRQRVFYKGVLRQRDVIPTMQQYDAFVLPTKAPTEGYPGSILEAYAAGLPVITTTCGGIPEIVDETSGILVEPGNVEALYQAMNRLVVDSELYVRLRNGARDKGGQFGAEHWAQKFVAYCREIARAPFDA